MKPRTLSPQEAYYVRTLAQRQLHIQQQAKKLKHLPLESIHQETGLPVFLVICMLMEAAGYTDTEMREVLR